MRSGPLISLPSDVREAQEKALKLRSYEQAVKSIGLGGTGEVDPASLGITPRVSGTTNHYSLPGLAPKPAPPPKPKIEGGLLGEVDKWEKEREALRKMGGFRASMMMPPPNQFVPPPSRPVSGAVDPQQAIMLQQQMMQQQQMMAPYQMMPQQMMPHPQMMQQHMPQNQLYPADYGAYPQQAQFNQLQPGMFGQHYPTQMPPQIAPQGPFPGYPYSEYGFEGGHEDPTLAANHFALRQQWLEAERIKERQRMMERGELSADRSKTGAGSSSGASSAVSQSKAKSSDKRGKGKKYDSSDSEEEEKVKEESSGTESDDENDIELDSDGGSSTSSDRQSLASRRHKLANRQSAAMSATSVGMGNRAPSEHSDSYSRASSGGVVVPLGGAPPPPAPLGMEFSMPGGHSGFPMHQYQRPGMHPPMPGYPYGYPGGPNGPVMYPPQQASQQQTPFNDMYVSHRLSYASGISQAQQQQQQSGIVVGTGMPNSPLGPSGRELIGERKRPTMPTVNASEAAAEEEAERRERERERRRRLRRRGVEVEGSTDEEPAVDENVTPTTANVESVVTPTAVVDPPKPSKKENVLEEPMQIAGGKEMLEEGELDKLLERASRKKKVSKKKEVASEDDSDSSSDEEIVIIRRKKKGKKKKEKNGF
ncbi:hypothetical protein BC830DRAFT_881131 [Chytriomyces sp. MP71]|nr:hypothetical protein BC830DRAFT_881131 [Chytriomyces sp. MP71]